MKIETIPVGPIGANCYLVYDEKKEAVVIDCGDEADRIIREIDARKLQVNFILLTHAHYDHIGAVDAVAAHTGATVVISKADAAMMQDPALNLSAYHDHEVRAHYDQTVVNGDTISSGDMSFSILATPGHTKGGVCYYTPGYLFSGDTLFFTSVGRCDFPGGSYEELIDSVMRKLMVLPEDTIVYPGHDRQSTIGYEKKNNPYVLNSN